MNTFLLLDSSNSLSDVFMGLYLGALTLAPLFVLLIIALIIGLIGLVIFAIFLVCNIKIFIKSGKKGWKAIIPFYRILEIYDIACNNATKILSTIPAFFAIGFYVVAVPIMLIPYVGLFMIVICLPIMLIINIAVTVTYAFLNFGLAKSFGMSTGMCVMSIFLPIVTRIMMAFGKYQYIGTKLEIIGKAKEEIPTAEEV